MKLNERNKVFSHFYINTNYKLENTIFLAGSGRSGTTWLSNIINYNNDFRMIFEPFHPKYTEECKQMLYKYIRPSNNNDLFFDSASKILSGRFKNEWIDRSNRKLFCGKRLIKEIRANLFLKWMKLQFPMVQFLFLMRHPCAVAVSRIKRKFKSQFDLYIEQEDLVNDYLLEHINEMKRCEDLFEKNIYMWCIENYVPLKQFRKGEIYVIFYEKLCKNPVGEMNNLFEWLNMKYSSKFHDAINKPSETAQKNSLLMAGKDLVSGWLDDVDKHMMTRALEILKSFGLDNIYNSSPWPVCDDVWR